MTSIFFRFINAIDNYFIAKQRMGPSQQLRYLQRIREIIIEYNEQDVDIFIGAPTLTEVEHQIELLEESLRV